MRPFVPQAQIVPVIDNESSQTDTHRNWMLVPSPLLGPASWSAVSGVLKSMGQSVVVASTTMTTTAAVDHLTPWLLEIAGIRPPDNQRESVVVGHSAACPRLPKLVSELVGKGWNITAMVLVDGRFPDGKAATEAEPSYANLLDSIVRPDDYLPPWPRWWGSLVDDLVVEPISRDMVLSEAKPIPRTWFDQPCPVPDLARVAKGFLSFGPGYQQSREQARQAGWTTATLFGDHLHQVVAPRPVALTLVGMVDVMVQLAKNP